MVCYLRFVGEVSRYTGVSKADAEEILRDIEREVGHNVGLIKAVVDLEKEKLARRLKKKSREKETTMAYG